MPLPIQETVCGFLRGKGRIAMVSAPSATRSHRIQREPSITGQSRNYIDLLLQGTFDDGLSMRPCHVFLTARKVPSETTEPKSKRD